MDEFPSTASTHGTSSTELLQHGFRYALSLTHHSQDAEDLVQEAWLRLTRKYGEITSRRLLFVTIRNVFIDQLRARGKRELVSLEDVISEPPAPEADFGGTTDLQVVLRQLRPVEREALYLHHVEGHTAEEIGQLTGTPRNTVLSLLSRGMRKLQALQKD